MSTSVASLAICITLLIHSVFVRTTTTTTTTEPRERFQFKNVATRRHLTVSDRTLTTREVCDATGDATTWLATWKENYDEHAVYELKNLESSLCLDSSRKHDQRFTETDASHAYVLSCNGGSFQRWLLVRLNQTRVTLRNLATMKYLYNHIEILDAVYVWRASPGTHYEWYLTKAHHSSPEEGVNS